MSDEAGVEEALTNFFKQEKYRSMIANAAAQRRESIMVDHSDLISFDEKLSHLIVEEPMKYLPILDRAAYRQLQVEDPEYASTLTEFKARVFNLPSKIPIREIRSHHLGKLIAVDGIMVRASAIRPMLRTAVFACSSCGAKYKVLQEASKLSPPDRCARCRGRKFELISDESEYIDFQLVGIQEKPEDLPPGQIPRIIDVGLKGDIVDVARPGDRVIVTGVLRTIQDREADSLRKTSKMYLEAVSMETASKEPESLVITPEEEKLFREMARDPEIHKKLVESIAPSLYGLEHIKKAVMLLLFGGRSKQYPDGTKVRGDIHILLVGDPGTGKSQ
ncbi:MAG TPA: minichromosome maintenance protein MCM, partial [Nitrososphaeria archaeon]|nr:minichromosome maintenance protein MCM [Nitrososphaeria archaeon]